MQTTAQSKTDTANTRITGKEHSISLGVCIPLTNFSATLSFGASLYYSWSKHRFGALSSIPIKPIGFTFNIGVDYFFGKKEDIGLYNYEYANYTFLHAYGGIIYTPGKKGNISLTTGPALDLYSGNAQFNIGINLSGNYYVTKKIAITPAILFMKESQSDPLWAAGLRATISF